MVLGDPSWCVYCLDAPTRVFSDNNSLIKKQPQKVAVLTGNKKKQHSSEAKYCPGILEVFIPTQL